VGGKVAPYPSEPSANVRIIRNGQRILEKKSPFSKEFTDSGKKARGSKLPSKETQHARGVECNYFPYVRVDVGSDGRQYPKKERLSGARNRIISIKKKKREKKLKPWEQQRDQGGGCAKGRRRFGHLRSGGPSTRKGIENENKWVGEGLVSPRRVRCCFPVEENRWREPGELSPGHRRGMKGIGGGIKKPLSPQSPWGRTKDRNGQLINA